jgi:hypothetical protein
LGTVAGPTAQVLTVTSQGDSTKFATVSMTTTVNQVAGVTVSTPANSKSGPPNSVVTFTITITNTGSVTDFYNWSVLSGGTTFAPLNPTGSSGSVAPGQSTTVDIQIQAGASGQDTVTIRFASNNDGAVFQDITLTTTVQ